MNLEHLLEELFKNCVFYIPSKETEGLNNYILNNEKSITEELSEKWLRFYYLKDFNLDNNLNNIINYNYPQYSISEINNQSFKESIEYFSKGKAGLLIYREKFEFLPFSNEEEEWYLCRIIISTLKSQRSFDDIDFLPNSIEELDEYILLDNETKQKVEEITKLFDELKSKGQLLSVLPMLEKYVDQLDHDKLSTLYVNNDYNISLPDYNKDIKLAPLTKAIYLLFLNHPEGILLTELHTYKKELTALYKCFTSKEDFNEMKASIDRVLEVSSKEVYVHLSRIRSAFTKQIHPRLALHYYIKGEKNKAKYISILNHPNQVIKNYTI